MRTLRWVAYDLREAKVIRNFRIDSWLNRAKTTQRVGTACIRNRPESPKNSKGPSPLALRKTRSCLFSAYSSQMTGTMRLEKYRWWHRVGRRLQQLRVTTAEGCCTLLKSVITNSVRVRSENHRHDCPYVHELTILAYTVVVYAAQAID